jgi:glycine betaine/proline transport system permease protein
MTVAAAATTATPTEDAEPLWRKGSFRAVVAFVPFLVFALYRRLSGESFPDALQKMPDAIVIDIPRHLNRFIDYLKDGEILGLFNFREVTRWIAAWIDYPLDFMEGLLRTGESSLGIGPIPWLMLVGFGGVLGWYLGSWKLSLLTAGSIFYFALFGLWDDSMKTLAVVSVAVPVSGLLGFGLGLLAAKRRWFERILVPFLNVLQAFPHFSYLLPVVVFVGLSNKAGVIATIVFAFPPMARLTLLGLRGISPEIIEAAKMSGTTARQMLWKVELPSARRSLMVGVNQVVMGALGMVVIASFIGTNGLGLNLKQKLGSLRIGEGLEVGIAVVLMAVVLDRLSQAWANREPEHREDVASLERFKFVYLALAIAVVTYILAKVTDSFNIYPEGWEISFAQYGDRAVDWSVANLPVESTKDFLLLNFLLPMRDLFRAIPWFVGVLFVAGLGWALKGPRLAIAAAAFPLAIALSGFWFESMETTYLVIAAVFVCMLIGVPLGIWASKSERRVGMMQVWLDTFQTLPSFIYLLPVIMLFRVGPAAVLTAMIIYPTVPAVRYTMLGLRGVPADKIEAAKTTGCTKRQLLWKVKLPLAMPEILLGLNQTILYALFMVIIGAFIGGINGLGTPLILSITNSDIGNGTILGLCVAFIGLTADKLITSWSADRKAQLGLL